MKVLSSIVVFAVAAVGLAVGQFGGPALERQGGVMGKPPMDRQDFGTMDPANAALILEASLAKLDPANCGPAPSFFTDDWVNKYFAPVQDRHKGWPPARLGHKAVVGREFTQPRAKLS